MTSRHLSIALACFVSGAEALFCRGEDIILRCLQRADLFLSRLGIPSRWVVAAGILLRTLAVRDADVRRILILAARVYGLLPSSFRHFRDADDFLRRQPGRMQMLAIVLSGVRPLSVVRTDWWSCAHIDGRFFVGFTDTPGVVESLVHEVSHVLVTGRWTPPLPDTPGVPPELTDLVLNVAEDIRIETFVRRRYPGIAAIVGKALLHDLQDVVAVGHADLRSDAESLALAILCEQIDPALVSELDLDDYILSELDGLRPAIREILDLVPPADMVLPDGKEPEDFAAETALVAFRSFLPAFRRLLPPPPVANL